MNFVEPIRDTEKIKDIEQILKAQNEKFYIMFIMGIYSGLRISDILKLRIRDIKGKENIYLREKKTGKEKYFPINKKIKKILEDYCKEKNEFQYLIPSDRKYGEPLSREYAYRVIKRAGEKVGLSHLGTHTMRKTFGYHFYIQTKDIVLLQTILNHNDQSKTLRYIGLEQSTIYKAMNEFKYY